MVDTIRLYPGTSGRVQRTLTKDGADVPFVLVNDPDSGDGRVILFDQKPDASVE